MENNFFKLCQELEARKDRSVFDAKIAEYARYLLDALKSRADFCEREEKTK